MLAVACAVIAGVAVAVAAAVSRYHRVYDVSPGAALVSTDGRSITVWDDSYSCVRPATVVVSETSRAVSVIERTAHDAFACTAQAWPSDLPWLVLTARLREPLGRRALTDGTTGRPLPWFDQRRELTPAFLPAGLTPGLPPSPSGYAFSGAPPGPGCTQLIRSAGSGWLTVTQLDGTVPAAQLRAEADGPWRAVQVRGHRGWLGSDRLTWYESDQTILIQAGHLYPSARARDAGLLAIARSLHLPRCPGERVREPPFWRSSPLRCIADWCARAG